MEVVRLLKDVAVKEGLNLPEPLAHKIARTSERNMRRALLCLETARVQQYPFAPNQDVQLPDWEVYIKGIASDILDNQSPQRLFAVRASLYELLVNCIPPHLILRRLAAELMQKSESEIKHEIAHWAAFYEHRLVGGSKAVFHLEAFVARFMSVYKNYLNAMIF